MLYSKTVENTYAVCHGCGLCNLVCPLWKQSYDLSYTPYGQAKFMQHGGDLATLGQQFSACNLCGACDVVCPKEIRLTETNLKVRQMLSATEDAQNEYPDSQDETPVRQAEQVLIADQLLIENQSRCRRVLDFMNKQASTVLHESVLNLDGDDIQKSLSLHACPRLVISDVLLLKQLRSQFPRVKTTSLSQYLFDALPLNSLLSADDLYIVDSRAYHLDFGARVEAYMQLKQNSECMMNLDLQRIAIPVNASEVSDAIDVGKQWQWITQGRSFKRVIVESLTEFKNIQRLIRSQPDRVSVLHLSDLIPV